MNDAAQADDGDDLAAALGGFIDGLKRRRDEAIDRADSKHALWMAELRKVTELEAQVQSMREAIKEAHEALITCATDEDALDVDDIPTSSGLHTTPEQREPLLSDFRVRCLVASRAALTKLKPFLS